MNWNIFKNYNYFIIKRTKLGKYHWFWFTSLYASYFISERKRATIFPKDCLNDVIKTLNKEYGFIPKHDSDYLEVIYLKNNKEITDYVLLKESEISFN